MKNLYFYRVDDWYTDELRKVCSTVRSNNSNHRESYVGILLEFNDKKYIAPITHTTKKSKINQIPIIFKENNKENKLGTILFHNMIPVYDRSEKPIYQLLDLNKIKQTNPKEFNKYMKQFLWINENKDKILDKAQETYNASKNKKHSDHYFISKILNCNFKALEDKMLEIQQQQKDLNKSINTNKETLENMDISELQKIYQQNQQKKKEQNLQKNSDLEL